jgi:hypothetical protein
MTVQPIAMLGNLSLWAHGCYAVGGSWLRRNNERIMNAKPPSSVAVTSKSIDFLEIPTAGARQLRSSVYIGTFARTDHRSYRLFQHSVFDPYRPTNALRHDGLLYSATVSCSGSTRMDYQAALYLCETIILLAKPRISSGLHTDSRKAWYLI